MLLPSIFQKVLCMSNATYKPHIPISSCVHIKDKHVTIYASHEPTAIYNVIRNTAKHTFHINGTFPWTNIPGTLNMYVPVHCYCDLYRDSILLYANAATHIYHVIAIHVPTTISPKNAIYASNFHMHIWCDNYVSIYTSYEPTAINSVTKCTGIHTFHIIEICPWANMPATIHIFVPLH